MADAAPARRAGRVRCFRRPAPAASRHGWPSNSWAAGAVDTAAVLGQALRLWKQLQRNSSRIPEPPWLLVLLKECMDNEEGSFRPRGSQLWCPGLFSPPCRLRGRRAENTGSAATGFSSLLGAQGKAISGQVCAEKRNGRCFFPFASLLLCVKHFLNTSSFNTQYCPLRRFFKWEIEAWRYLETSRFGRRAVRIRTYVGVVPMPCQITFFKIKTLSCDHYISI